MTHSSDPETADYGFFLGHRARLWAERRKLTNPALAAEMAVVARLSQKVVGYDWARAQGVPSVRYRVFNDVRAALASELPYRFVLKPRVGHSSVGVYLLHRRVDGQYQCAMTNRVYKNTAAIAEAYLAEVAPQRRTVPVPDVLIEEVIEDRQRFEVPLDYKVYAFASGCPMVMQRHAPRHLPKEKWAFQFYDSDGWPLGVIRKDTADNVSAVGLRAPDNLDEIFAVARRLIAATGVSFLRLDLYATPDGVAFGEITGVPNAGKERYVPEWEAILGQHWRDSLDMLGLRYG